MTPPRLIVALDLPDAASALAATRLFDGLPVWLKVGLELFTAEGPEVVRTLRKNAPVFLDLKFHDIPNTVKKAMAALSALDVDMVNLHAAGARAMMEAALEGLTRPDGSRPLLIAVTQLTSTSEEQMQNELLIHASMAETVAPHGGRSRWVAIMQQDAGAERGVGAKRLG